jgi:glycosyltransferase involved in cell wall biosynthesis
MRIAIVLNTSWNIYNFRKGLALALLENGHEVIAIAPEDKYSGYLIEMGCEFHPVRMQNKGSNPLKDFSYMRQLYRIYKRANPDVILQFTIKPNIYGTLAAYPLRKLVVNNVCGLGTVFLHDNLTAKVAQMLYRFSFRFPKRVFFQNEDDRSLFVEKKLIRSKATDLLPGSGIPLDKFMPTEFKRNEEFSFLMIARLLYDKGICEYVEAARIAKKNGIKAKFQILGAIDTDKNLGISEAQLQAWIEEGVIEYLGTTDDVPAVIAQADVVVLPSYREGTPRALLEAASMGKPIITTDIAGCRQTVDNGINGYLCEVKNAKDLAAKIEKMYALDNQSLMKMGQASRLKVENEFDEKIVIQKYLDILKSYGVLLRRNTRKINSDTLNFSIV